MDQDAISLWKFDPREFPGGCVVRDFCRRTGIDVPTQIVRVNESLSYQALAILYCYRKFGPGYGAGQAALRENAAIIEALRQVEGDRFRLSERVVRPILSSHRDDIQWMEHRLRASLEEVTGDQPVEIRSEEDLFHVDPDAVISFFRAFERQTRVALQVQLVTRRESGPRAVAAAVQACREELRRALSLRKASRRRGKRRPRPATGANA
jgi:hypothetical protein